MRKRQQLMTNTHERPRNELLLPHESLTHTPERIAMATDQEFARVFALQREKKWELKRSSIADRKARLQRLAAHISGLTKEVAAALMSDLGRPSEDMPFDLGLSIAAIDEILERLDAWAKPTPATPKLQAPGAKAYLHYEGRGAILLLGPWNFPIHLVLVPLATMVAAGNTVIVKPSEMAPASSALIAGIIRAVFPEDEVAVFEGDRDTATRLLELPFDHMMMTGSPKVGKIMMAAAAKHLSSVTLELGGKNPAFIDETADLASAAQHIGDGRVANNGQNCMATDYVLLPRGVRDGFVDALSTYWRSTLFEGETYQSSRVGRFVDRRNYQRVTGYLDTALAAGAKIVFGGRRDDATLTIEPTVIIDVPHDSPLFEEEVFGPVVTVVPYDKLDDALKIVEAKEKSLSLSIFSKDAAYVAKVIDGTSSGNVSVNNWAYTYLDQRLPFGGVNGSGIGRYHSVHGFREFSHERAVFETA